MQLINTIKFDTQGANGGRGQIKNLMSRVAGFGRLSAGANMAMKPFVKRVITIFATNASFLRVISNFRI